MPTQAVCSFFAAVVRQSLGMKRCLYYGDPEDPLACSSPACPLLSRRHHKHLPQALCVECTHLVSYKREGFSGNKPRQSGSSGTCCAHSLESPGWCLMLTPSPSPFLTRDFILCSLGGWHSFLPVTGTSI